MCGITGYTGHEIRGLLDRMIDAIRHRGPDGSGRFERDGVHFGHTRLAIIDPDNGDQPMVRDDGNVVVTYNGEIYNYDDLRTEIEKAGKTFETHCDTELLPLGYSAFGPSFFERLNGMFAFALWDGRTGELHLVRDHFGIKPLFYATTGKDLVFSSCARALALHPEVSRRLRPDAVREYLQYRYSPSGMHFFEGVETLPPGTIATWRNGELKMRAYWNPGSGTNDRPEVLDDWVGRVRDLLSDSLCGQLRSDVPVGVFLSGGIDSTAVTHFAAAHGGPDLTAITFSTGDSDDETAAAVDTARRYGARHVTVAWKNRGDFGELYDAIACMDLPVGDAIVLPTYELCRAAARDLKVVLTGEGADEVFGGYVHYPVLKRLAVLSLIPGLRWLAPIVRYVPVGLLDRFFDYPASLGQLGRRKVAALIESLDRPAMLPRIATTVIDDAEITEAALLPPPPPPGDADLSLRGLMRDGIATWLPYQILNKMDQLSMAHGLEARVPFLDPRIYELLVDAPESLFLKNGEDKVLLRDILRREGIPNAGRPKQAFHVPMETRYRDSNLKLAREWLSESRVREHHVLNQPFVDRAVTHLERGEFLASKQVVTMACLHMWMDAHGASA